MTEEEEVEARMADLKVVRDLDRGVAALLEARLFCERVYGDQVDESKPRMATIMLFQIQNVKGFLAGILNAGFESI